MDCHATQNRPSISSETNPVPLSDDVTHGQFSEQLLPRPTDIGSEAVREQQFVVLTVVLFLLFTSLTSSRSLTAFCCLVLHVSGHRRDLITSRDLLETSLWCLDLHRLAVRRARSLKRFILQTCHDYSVCPFVVTSEPRSTVRFD